ncbi:MAG: AMP-binding protein, partial [Burkholderiaceae bacterium]
MYPAVQAKANPTKPAFIMASTGETVTYGELEARTNRLAHLFRTHGLKHRDHYSTFMENNSRSFECSGAGERSGLHYTCINSFLKADEVAYILNNSESRALIISRDKREVALEALKQCPNVSLCLIIGATGDDGPFIDFEQAVAGYPDTPIADERLGSPMLYSSGTTGRPKGILRDLPDNPPSEQMPLYPFLSKLWEYKEDMVYLSPAPLYHSAPQAANALCIRAGGTSIVMEKFDPEQYLALVEKYRVTHSQLVPTMFTRMLKLPEEVRKQYDVSSLETIVHAAAPCPVPVKQAMIDWWGPIVHEYYGATEGMGFTACNTEEWLAHPGTVGKVIMGDLHILNEDMTPAPKGQPGEIWFKTANQFVYFNDPERTAASRSADGSLSTVGDIGYVTDDG